MSLDLMKDDEVVSLLNESHYFGEIALIYNSYRTLGVETKHYTTLAVLSQKDLFEIF